MVAHLRVNLQRVLHEVADAYIFPLSLLGLDVYQLSEDLITAGMQEIAEVRWAHFQENLVEVLENLLIIVVHVGLRECIGDPLDQKRPIEHELL